MSRITIHCPHCKLMNRLDTRRINEAPECVRCKLDLLQEKPIEGTLANLAGLIMSEQTILVQFKATWCSACSHFEPSFEKVSAKRPKICFVTVDIQEQTSLAEQYKIRTIPTIMLFKNGEVVDTLNDALSEEKFKQWLDNALLK